MPDVSGSNAWHTDVARSPACSLIFQQGLGLPQEVVSNSLLPWAAIAEVAAALRLSPGQILIDLACGRGCYGREVARRTGARLVGLDCSAVAVAIAARGGQRDHAWFAVADFTALGLGDHSADAVMCVDAIQFSDAAGSLARVPPDPGRRRPAGRHGVGAGRPG